MQKCSYFLRFASVRLFWRKIDALLQDGWAKGASRIKLDALLQVARTDQILFTRQHLHAILCMNKTDAKQALRDPVRELRRLFEFSRMFDRRHYAIVR
jgi:hypothetical protein